VYFHGLVGPDAPHGRRFVLSSQRPRGRRNAYFDQCASSARLDGEFLLSPGLVIHPLRRVLLCMYIYRYLRGSALKGSLSALNGLDGRIVGSCTPFDPDSSPAVTTIVVLPKIRKIVESLPFNLWTLPVASGAPQRVDVCFIDYNLSGPKNEPRAPIREKGSLVGLESFHNNNNIYVSLRTGRCRFKVSSTTGRRFPPRRSHNRLKSRVVAFGLDSQYT
jgi:hypothetical protein